MPLALDTAVQFLRGVGPRRAEAFGRMGVRTAEDLLYHVPHRYLDATTVTPIARATVGAEVTVVGRVVSKAVVPTRRRLRIFRAVLRDDSGVVECAWPGQAFLDRTIRQGQQLLVTGPVRFYHGRQLVPREYVILADEGDEPEHDGAEGLILPVYPATEGLSHRVIRRIVADHLDALVARVEDDMPARLREEAGVPTLAVALRMVHRPETRREQTTGRRRLALDELLDLQLVVARARHLAKHRRSGITFTVRRELTTRLKDGLPFRLTAGQRQAIREIMADMTGEDRMHRLLMGDVGTGKTVVALFAMLLAVENDYQAVFMAPTELLAEQHARTISALLAPLGQMPEVLLGRLSAGEKSAIRRRLAQGNSPIVVGTHALIQETTAFERLGLVVIDEQHRFGVEQRAALIAKGEQPDVLLLSATPIPRTLALTLYGDLDISTLTERPAGRGNVETSFRAGSERRALYALLRDRCAAGQQAYVVYPVIEESERVDLKAATTMAAELAKRLVPVSVGLVHGRMKPEERDRVMRSFRDGKTGVLVATTVIEVGIDVPNATVMVIEHPERFGLAQLHQLRGRVGRGDQPSQCILVTEGTGGSYARLEAFAKTSDGFKIAELDLRERGMGELVGTRQSGGFYLRFADLAADADLVILARREAMRMIEEDPLLESAVHLPLRRRLERRYERGMELFRVG
ncbi:MAG TPA: ATP-dependent DNA helicase RecG [Gemmatimonadales bacterium]|jgi:ATP-dependent DNA helicase RecG